MLNFEYIGKGGYFCGYAPDRYRVILDKQYTVQEFIDEVINTRSNEYGDIKTKCYAPQFDSLVYKYRTKDYKLNSDVGLLTDISDYDSVLSIVYRNFIIESVTAEGGYTNMDYVIKIKF